MPCSGCGRHRPKSQSEGAAAPSRLASRSIAWAVVEGLGQPLNLMLSRSIELAPTAAQALERLARRLGAAVPSL